MTYQNGARNTQAFQEGRKHLLRFDMHEVASCRLGAQAGLAITLARIEQATQSGQIAKCLRKVAPLADAAQAFVQKNQSRRSTLGGRPHRAWFNPKYLQGLMQSR
jgi:hypothetical protein